MAPGEKRRSMRFGRGALATGAVTLALVFCCGKDEQSGREVTQSADPEGSSDDGMSQANPPERPEPEGVPDDESTAAAAPPAATEDGTIPDPETAPAAGAGGSPELPGEPEPSEVTPSVDPTPST